MESEERDPTAREEETQTERAERYLHDANSPGYAAEMAGAEPEEGDDSPPAS